MLDLEGLKAEIIQFDQEDKPAEYKFVRAGLVFACGRVIENSLKQMTHLKLAASLGVDLEMCDDTGRIKVPSQSSGKPIELWSWSSALDLLPTPEFNQRRQESIRLFTDAFQGIRTISQEVF